jgi:hypothetical protein
MAATGLPIVSTELRAAEGLAEGIHVERSSDAFVERVGQIGRATESTDTIEELVALARANDYDVKFSRIQALVADVASSPVSRRDDAERLVGPELWHQTLADPPLPARVLGALRARTPTALRRLVPSAIRQRARLAGLEEHRT